MLNKAFQKYLLTWLLLNLAFYQLRSQTLSWNDLCYTQYNHLSFANLERANEQIDFTNIDYPLLNAALFYETNRVRERHGLKPGKHSGALEKGASGHSIEMVKRGFFSHIGKTKGRKTLRERLDAVGIRGGMIAENIAISFGINYESGRPVYKPSQNGGFFSYDYKGKPINSFTYLELAARVLDQWMKSPGHRANIMLGLEYIGCGAFLIPIKKQDDFPKFKITQNFSSKDYLP